MTWAERQEDEFPGDVSASKAAAEVGSSVWIPLVPGSTQWSEIGTINGSDGVLKEIKPSEITKAQSLALSELWGKASSGIFNSKHFAIISKLFFACWTAEHKVRKLPLSDSICDANILTSDFPFACLERTWSASEGRAWQGIVCAGTFSTLISQFAFTVHYLVMMCNTVIKVAECFKRAKFM